MIDYRYIGHRGKLLRFRKRSPAHTHAHNVRAAPCESFRTRTHPGHEKHTHPFALNWEQVAFKPQPGWYATYFGTWYNRAARSGAGLSCVAMCVYMCSYIRAVRASVSRCESPAAGLICARTHHSPFFGAACGLARHVVYTKQLRRHQHLEEPKGIPCEPHQLTRYLAAQERRRIAL